MQQHSTSKLSKVKVGDYVVFSEAARYGANKHILRDTMDGVPYPIEAMALKGQPCPCGCGADCGEDSYAIIDDVADPVGLYLVPADTVGMIFKTREEVEAYA